MFVTCQEKCYKLTCDTCEEVHALKCSEEEADTRLFLYAQHAAQKYHSIIIVADDTDVFVICLSLSSSINSNIYLRRGTRSRVRMVNITQLSSALGREVCSALPGLHSWTGCDTVSGLANQGKIKALKMVQQHQIYRDAFTTLGTLVDLAPETFKMIQKFTCQLYSKNTKINKVNDLRYQMFCAKKGDIESGQLPPCEDTLRQHTLRANYQAAIWRHSLDSSPDTREPSAGHGWEVNDEGDLVIKWMSGLPAPDVVPSLISCNCKRKCVPTDCSCMLNGLKCTTVCKLQNFLNMAVAHDDSEDNQDSSDSDCESEDD